MIFTVIFSQWSYSIITKLENWHFILGIALWAKVISFYDDLFRVEARSVPKRTQQNMEYK